MHLDGKPVSREKKFDEQGKSGAIRRYVSQEFSAKFPAQLVELASCQRTISDSTLIARKPGFPDRFSSDLSGIDG